MQTKRLIPVVVTTALLLLAGCSAPPPQPPASAPDDSYCQTSMKPRRNICVLAGVPVAAIAQEAAALGASEGALTVYIMRNNWTDPTELTKLRAPGGVLVQTLPRTFVRLRLPPGQNELSVDWRSGSAKTVVTGAAGEVQYLQLTGWAFWTWRDYSLLKIDRAKALELSRDAKFVADVQGR